MNIPTDLSSYVRVLKMASTPSWTEFSRTGSIAGVGILLIGALGFLMFLLMNLLPG